LLALGLRFRSDIPILTVKIGITTMRILLLTALSCCLVLAAAACGSTSRDAGSSKTYGSNASEAIAPADTSHPTPTISTLRRGKTTRATATFRGVGDGESAIGDGERPLVLMIGERRIEAPFVAGPSRFREGGATVEQAAYRLPDGMRSKLLQTPARNITVRVHDGAAYRSYPYVSGDLIE
jgi:hypothetical protein